MKTNSKVGKLKARKQLKASNNRDLLLIQKSSNAKAFTHLPDYSEMHKAILEIANPVPFEDLKVFYGME